MDHIDVLDIIQGARYSEEKTMRCDTMDDYYGAIENKDLKKHLIVLPPDHDGMDVMLETLHKTNTCKESFHYNGRRQIDGFITGIARPEEYCDNKQ